MSEPSIMEKWIDDKIDNKFKDYHIESIEKDIKEIIKELIPEIDKMISDKIKFHLKEISKFTVDSLCSEKEK